MGRFKGVAAVLIILSALLIIGFCINTNTASAVKKHLENSIVLGDTGNSSAAAEELVKASDIWENSVEYVLLFVPHTRVDRIDEAVSGALMCLEEGDTSMYRSYCKSAIHLIDHLYRMEYPNFTTIF